MSADSLLRLLEIGLETLQSAFWPLALLILLFYFGPTLKQLLQNTSEMNLSAGGVELQMKMKMEAAAALAAAQATRAAAPDAQVGDASAADIVSLVDRVAAPNAVSRFMTAHVLWVDDIPANNRYERRTLEALGIRILLATSTEEALDKLAGAPVDAVISDMGRPPDNRAGYTLLDQMRAQGYRQPYIIYAGSNRPEHRAEAREHGALASTNDPRELFQLVTTAILGSS